MKERLTKIHSLEIEAVEGRYSDIVKTLRGDKDELNKLIKEKDNQIDG